MVHPTEGLTEQEAIARRASGLGNTAPPATGRTYGQIVRENVFTVINNCLFGLGLALVAVGRPLDAAVSVGVILINVIVSVVQEVRAKRTLDRIALLTRPRATVIRDGCERALRPEALVVGDLVKVAAGDQIVLDGALTGPARITVDESQLSGESDPIPKQTGDPVYSGSFCVSGSGYYLVERVGEASLANRITAGARAFRRVLTPLQRQVNLVVRIMLAVVLYKETLLVLGALLTRTPLIESVGDATIIAGLIPNGLFLSIAVAYAIGAVRLLRFGALVQQANAVESLSNVDVICLDKTGTLTANRLLLREVWSLDSDHAALRRTVGDLVASAGAGNRTSEAIASRCPGQARRVLAEVPFSSARKWSAVALDESAEQRGIFVLGAQEMLEPQLLLDPADAERLAERSAGWAAEGLRVLLVAQHPNPALLQDQGDDSVLPPGLRPLGLLAFADELRPEARETLAAFIKTGVQPKIISGDNPETVAALARQAGLGPEIRLISGPELEQLDPEQFAAAAAANTIFGRISPHQKERLVAALRRRGHYVAMIGDGVNDVLALKQANLGVAMQGGSQASRSVADVVLMNDSFAALPPAVAEGQRIVNGMMDILQLFLTRIVTVALLITSSAMGVFPLALRNASLVALLTVGIPTVLLALWARPGPRQQGSLAGRLVHFVLPAAFTSNLIGLLVFYGAFLLRFAELGLDHEASGAIRTVREVAPQAQTALAAFLVLVGLLLVVFAEPPTEWWTGADELSSDWRPALLAFGLMALFGLIMLVPGLRVLFDLRPLDPSTSLLVVAGTLTWLFLVRLIWRRRLFERFFSVESSAEAG